jgi:hypothetical protein
MIPFTIYSAATGAILRIGVVRSQDIPLQAKAGEAILSGTQGNRAKQKVDITKTPPVLMPQ